jgi:uncharacterized protein YegL
MPTKNIVKQEIVIILDKSGSMAGSREDIIGGFNTYIEDLRKEEDIDAKLTIYMFDDNTHKLFSGEKLSNVSLLDSKTYCPGGCTALNDCFMTAIEDVEARLKKSKAKNKPQVIFVVFTDGYENTSKTHTDKDVIKTRKNDKEGEGWAFIFMGADMDAWSAGSSYGVSIGNTVSLSKQNIGASADYLRNRTVKAANLYRSASTNLMTETQYATAMNNLMEIDEYDLENDAEAVALRKEIDQSVQGVTSPANPAIPNIPTGSTSPTWVSPIHADMLRHSKYSNVWDKTRIKNDDSQST